MTYEYLTNLIKFIATEENLDARINFYYQYDGAYTALFFAHAITSAEFCLYAEMGKFIFNEIFEL